MKTDAQIWNYCSKTTHHQSRIMSTWILHKHLNLYINKIRPQFTSVVITFSYTFFHSINYSGMKQYWVLTVCQPVFNALGTISTTYSAQKENSLHFSFFPLPYTPLSESPASLVHSISNKSQICQPLRISRFEPLFQAVFCILLLTCLLT